MIGDRRIKEEQIDFIPDRQQERIKARKLKQKKRRQKRKFILTVVIVILLVTLLGLLFSSIKSNLAVIKGTWIYDSYTSYEFDGEGNGCMCLEEIRYNYTYKIKGDILSIDFKDDSLRDCSYTFQIDGSKLTLVGGEGTVGGTYDLNKK